MRSVAVDSLHANYLQWGGGVLQRRATLCLPSPMQLGDLGIWGGLVHGFSRPLVPGFILHAPLEVAVPQTGLSLYLKWENKKTHTLPMQGMSSCLMLMKWHLADCLHGAVFGKQMNGGWHLTLHSSIFSAHHHLAQCSASEPGIHSARRQETWHLSGINNQWCRPRWCCRVPRLPSGQSQCRMEPDRVRASPAQPYLSSCSIK